MKQSELASWLKAIVIFTGAVGLVFLLLFAPGLTAEIAGRMPEGAIHTERILIFIWVVSLPVYMALFCVWRICCEISRNNSFSHRNAMLLRNVSYICLLECVVFLAAGISLMLIGCFDILLLLLVFSAILVGVFLAAASAALSHLTDKAAALKHENDLTI